MHLEAAIEHIWRYTWSLWSSELRHALWGRDWASLEMHLKTMNVQIWKRESSEFGAALGGRDCASLEAIIMRVWGCTWRPWSCELGGHNGATLDEYLEAVNGRRAGCRDTIHQLVNSQLWECDKVTLSLSSRGELADGGRSCREARRKLKLHSAVNS